MVPLQWFLHSSWKKKSKLLTMIYKALHDLAPAAFSRFLILPHCMLIQSHWPSFKFLNMPNSLHLRAFAHAILFASTTLLLVFLRLAPIHSSNLTKYQFCREAFPKLQSKHYSLVSVIEQFVIKNLCTCLILPSPLYRVSFMREETIPAIFINAYLLCSICDT